MQGSHGFTQSSKWAPRVGAFINLESTGNGGPDVVFQHTAHWTVQTYAVAAVHPRGSVIGQVPHNAQLSRMETTSICHTECALDMQKLKAGMTASLSGDTKRSIDTEHCAVSAGRCNTFTCVAGAVSIESSKNCGSMATNARQQHPNSSSFETCGQSSFTVHTTGSLRGTLVFPTQDIFDMGLLPADTDFRMFSYGRQGAWPGLDVAFLLDAAAYHTDRDTTARIRSGTLQAAPPPPPPTPALLPTHIVPASLLVTLHVSDTCLTDVSFATKWKCIVCCGISPPPPPPPHVLDILWEAHHRLTDRHAEYLTLHQTQAVGFRAGTMCGPSGIDALDDLRGSRCAAQAAGDNLMAVVPAMAAKLAGGALVEADAAPHASAYMDFLGFFMVRCATNALIYLRYHTHRHLCRHARTLARTHARVDPMYVFYMLFFNQLIYCCCSSRGPQKWPDGPTGFLCWRRRRRLLRRACPCGSWPRAWGAWLRGRHCVWHCLPQPASFGWPC